MNKIADAAPDVNQQGEPTPPEQPAKGTRLEPYQKRKLIISLLMVFVVAASFLGYAATTLYKDKTSEDSYWSAALQNTEHAQQRLDAIAQNATQVTCGTYIDNVKEIGLKNSNFSVQFLVWFRWEGSPDLDMAHHFRVYKGNITKSEIVRQEHENGVNYQLVRCDATVSKNYWTIRFPLESHQLRMYIESNYTADKVVFVPDKENSGVNASLSFSGYKLLRHDIGVYTMEYETTHGDPSIPNPEVTSEIVTAMEINRSSWGLYLKCFIALIGTTLWVFITLFLNTYHKVDPLSMIPAALFGTVSNIMVGANLLPDALQTGLVEYVNIWGVFTILAVALTIININRIRSKFQDKKFASLYGKIMFYTLLTVVLAGHVLLPLSAYLAK